MSEEFWAETVNHASYLVNRSPSIIIDLQISEEIWCGESMDYSTLQIFGCPAYSLADSQKGANWSPSLRNISSLGLPKESRVSDFGSRDKERL